MTHQIQTSQPTVDTPCQHCCFAEYEGHTQVDCKRGMLDKYREIGTEILDAWNYEGEFFVIKGRSCRYYRTDAWMEQFESAENMEKALSLETTLKFQVIILLRDRDVHYLKSTVDSLLNETYKPAIISVIRPHDSVCRPTELTEVFDDCPVVWKIYNLLYEQPEESSIHKALNDKRVNYYSTVCAGEVFPAKLFQNINDSVNNKLIRFGMIEDHETNIKVIPLSVHNYWYFNGDPDKTIAEKIEDYQCQNPEEKIVYNSQEVLVNN